MKHVALFIATGTIFLLTATPIEAQPAREEPRQQEILANPGLNAGQQIGTSVGVNFLGKLGIDVHTLFARIRYGYNANQESIFESFPELSRYGPIYETSALDLMPSDPQKEFSPPDEGHKASMYPLKGMAGYRYCAPGSTIDESGKDNVPLAGVTATIGNIGTKAYPRAWAQLVWATQYFSSLTTRAKTEGTDYIARGGNMVNFQTVQERDSPDGVFLNVDPEVLDSVLYQCGAGSEGSVMRRIEKEAEGEARTTGGEGGFFSTITAKFQEIFFQGSLIPCNEEDKEGHCAESRIYILPTDSIAALPAVTSQTIGISVGQLSQGMPLGDRAKIVNDGGGNSEMRTEEGQKGGFVRSFLSSTFVKNIDYQNAAAPQRQAFAFHNRSGNESRDAYPLWMRSLTDGLVCAENAYTPKGLQKPGAWCRYSQGEPAPNAPNTSSWALSHMSPSAAFTPSGDFAHILQQVARESGMPQCVMEGVAHIEGGSRYEEMPLDQCLQTTNRCSAVGPMQFTVGPGYGQATEEVCRDQCEAGYCPNAWSRYGNGGNPCRYADALSAAGRYLADYGHFGQGDLKDSVHDAATAYYGSDDNELARSVLGGCEYWEFVYQHCDPGYVCRAR